MGEENRIRTPKGKKVWLWTAMSFVIIFSLGSGFWYLNREKEVEIDVDLNEIEFARSIQFGDSLGNAPIILVNGTNVSTMTALQQRQMINNELEAVKLQEVTAMYDDVALRTTLGDLGLHFEKDVDVILSELSELNARKEEEQTAMRLRMPLIGEYELSYIYDSSKVDEWIMALESQINVSVIEPVLTRLGGGFNVTPGRTGISMQTVQLTEAVHKELTDLRKETFNIEIEVEYIQPNASQSALESVNARISSATSTFPLSDIERTHNVKLATQKVDGILLMPGQEFSFAAAVEPVTFAGGYKAATIFIDGESSEGVGGGICQISSTLYWAQLRAGILPTQRRGHSLPVGYVPLGLDATYATGGIDYRFANTLDYPIYIHAYTEGNVLNIELWSNNQALNGLTFEPRVAQVDNNEQSQTWATYLRTYKEGGLVSENFLHNSTYRHPRR